MGPVHSGWYAQNAFDLAAGVAHPGAPWRGSAKNCVVVPIRGGHDEHRRGPEHEPGTSVDDGLAVEHRLDVVRGEIRRRRPRLASAPFPSGTRLIQRPSAVMAIGLRVGRLHARTIDTEPPVADDLRTEPRRWSSPARLREAAHPTRMHPARLEDVTRGKRRWQRTTSVDTIAPRRCSRCSLAPSALASEVLPPHPWTVRARARTERTMAARVVVRFTAASRARDEATWGHPDLRAQFFLNTVDRASATRTTTSCSTRRRSSKVSSARRRTGARPAFTGRGDGPLSPACHERRPRPPIARGPRASTPSRTTSISRTSLSLRARRPEARRRRRLPRVLLARVRHAGGRPNSSKARRKIRRALRWDDRDLTLPIPGCVETSVCARLEDDDLEGKPRDRRPAIGDRLAPKVKTVYLFADEALYELSNDTIHALLHMGLVGDRVSLAVYVKHRGIASRLSPAAIPAARHLFVCRDDPEGHESVAGWAAQSSTADAQGSTDSRASVSPPSTTTASRSRGSRPHPSYTPRAPAQGMRHADGIVGQRGPPASARGRGTRPRSARGTRRRPVRASSDLAQSRSHEGRLVVGPRTIA